ncbi:MAG TPA: gliding motility-associated C-terminal domain-containing protein, partial [Bacteroidales bacterium]|nr:gliding motility-associated C-terminal domain-containing protein [Bacteroidales bacterium]
TGGFGFCDQGKDTSITIYLNPTPRISVFTPDTIYCDSSLVSFTVTDHNGNVMGDKKFDFSWSVTPDAGSVDGVEPPGLHNRTGFSDYLTNKTKRYQVIAYRFRATITDLVTGLGRCFNGTDTILRIYLNPTPEIAVTANTGMLCDSSSVSFTITDLNGPVIGTKLYNLITESDPSIQGVQTNTEYPVIYNFSDTIINLDTTWHTIKYHFKARFRDVRPGDPSYWCDQGRIVSQEIVSLPAVRAYAHSDSSDYLFGYDVSCYGWSTGVIKLDVAGGYMSYNPSSVALNQYHWNSGETTRDITGKPAGNYSVLITDNYGCKGYAWDTIKQPPQLLASLFIDSTLACGGYSNGVIHIAIRGGVYKEPYKLTWYQHIHPIASRTIPYLGDTVRTDTLKDLTAGLYKTYLVDANRCSRGDYIWLPSPEDIVFNFNTTEYEGPNSITEISCFGSRDAELQPNIFGGTLPYNVTLRRPLLPDTLFTMTSHDGPLFTNLRPGIYEFNLIDGNGCPQYGFYEIKEPPPLNITLVPSSPYGDSIAVSCHGGADGTIATLPEGGHGNYSYLWSTSGGSGLVPDARNQTNLSAGIYYLVLTDTARPVLGIYEPKLCTARDTIQLMEPPPLLLSVDSLSLYAGNYNVSCFDAANGSAFISVSGGVPPYQYLWTTSDGGGNLMPDAVNQTGITAGTYNVKVSYGVSQGYNCSQNWNITLVQPDSIAFHPTVSSYNGFEVACFGDSSGRIDPGVTGGAGPYQFLWSSPDGSGIVQGDSIQYHLTRGTFTVFVTDMNNCTNQRTFVLNQPSPLNVSFDSIHYIKCSGANTGGIDITASGGLGGYTYLWDNGHTTPHPRNMGPGYHAVTITDINGCQFTDSASIGEAPPIMSVSRTSRFGDYQISCADSTNGYIVVKAAGGTGSLRYQWSNQSTSDSIYHLDAGTYSVIITDEYDCSDTLTFDLIKPTPIFTNFRSDSVTCYGLRNGMIQLRPTGGVPPYRYLWSDGQTFANALGLPAGIHQVRITDANNCPKDTTIEIFQPLPLHMSISQILPWCPETNDGALSIRITGGIPDYNQSTVSMLSPQQPVTYEIDQNLISVTNADAGTYAIHIVDHNQCSLDTVFRLRGFRGLCLNIPNVFTPNNDGTNDVWEITFGREQTTNIASVYPELVIEVYNRWGQLVYKSEKGYPTPWDGKVNGQKVPVDSYYYVISIHEGSNPVTGTVTIVY